MFFFIILAPGVCVFNHFDHHIGLITKYIGSESFGFDENPTNKD